MFNRHADSTLMGMTKKELIKYVRVCERNRDTAEAIVDQQAENVKDWEPVRHARWEEAKVGTATRKMCSACEKTVLSDTKYSYCPYCGAKMEE